MSRGDVSRSSALQEQHRQRPIRPGPPDSHGLLRSVGRLRFGPFLPGSPLLPSDCCKVTMSWSLSAAAESSTTAFHLREPPTHTWETLASTMRLHKVKTQRRGSGGTGDVKHNGDIFFGRFSEHNEHEEKAKVCRRGFNHVASVMNTPEGTCQWRELRHSAGKKHNHLYSEILHRHEI